MIINRCRDVVIRLKQADYSRQIPFEPGDEWRDWDVIQPGSNQIPFAWDEPRQRHVVKVVAASQHGPDSDPVREIASVFIRAAQSGFEGYV
jgi:hypothetical protein